MGNGKNFLQHQVMNQLQHIKKPSKNLIKHGNKEKCNFIKNYNIFNLKLFLLHLQNLLHYEDLNLHNDDKTFYHLKHHMKYQNIH